MDAGGASHRMDRMKYFFLPNRGLSAPAEILPLLRG